MNEELEQLQVVSDAVSQYLLDNGVQIVITLVILAMGYMIAKKLGRAVEGLMIGKNIDVTLSRFVGNSAHLVILVLVILMVLGRLGVSVTPLIAIVGALSLGAGLALQGMLSNYAAGFTIILTRPFVVGDTLSVQGQTGLVESVHLAYTILIDEDDVRIQIPNRLVVGEIMHNSKEQKLVELCVGVAYKSDPHQVITVVAQALKTIDGINIAHGPLIGIDEFADSSINIGIRFFAPTYRYFEFKYRANLAIYDAFKGNGIEIPFPQREVSLINTVSK
ncbi:mechanosensitive ion channel family protein [uncultured Paraglaciecola sp.]|uniref:mechanosensitive ion channel family protein n=1 Tax=uncultured Paraglaciecola sp. TaxID=1765024 RepID=UPI00261BD003|nr:mechanosensitive ion channel family protein [uncultured Paraglaciecola sp.]